MLQWQPVGPTGKVLCCCLQRKACGAASGRLQGVEGRRDWGVSTTYSAAMFLTYSPDGSLVHIKSLEALLDPFVNTVEGRFHAGEEIQDPQAFSKCELRFPSGEQLPRCWLDPDYGHHRVLRQSAEGLRA